MRAYRPRKKRHNFWSRQVLLTSKSEGLIQQEAKISAYIPIKDDLKILQWSTSDRKKFTMKKLYINLNAGITKNSRVDISNLFQSSTIECSSHFHVGLKLSTLSEKIHHEKFVY